MSEHSFGSKVDKIFRLIPVKHVYYVTDFHRTMRTEICRNPAAVARNSHRASRSHTLPRAAANMTVQKLCAQRGWMRYVPTEGLRWVDGCGIFLLRGYDWAGPKGTRLRRRSLWRCDLLPQHTSLLQPPRLFRANRCSPRFRPTCSWKT
eukprot:2437321-Pyramimonas_sp.AAC.1